MDAFIDISKVRLETERLILRPWRLEDLQDLYSYASEDGVGQMAGWMPHRSPEESRIVLERFIESKRNLAIELKESGKVIGSVGLQSIAKRELFEPYESLPGRELGYILAREYWGRGLMSEALKAAIWYCFEETECEFLLLNFYKINHRSEKIAKKFGFHIIQEIRDYDSPFGPVEADLALLKKDDWLAEQLNSETEISPKTIT